MALWLVALAVFFLGFSAHALFLYLFRTKPKPTTGVIYASPTTTVTRVVDGDEVLYLAESTTGPVLLEVQ